MPRISVNEIDATVATEVAQTAAKPVALIGFASWGETNTPKLCNTVAEFKNTFGAEIPEGQGRLGYLAALRVLRNGCPVLYSRIADSTTAAKATLELENAAQASVIKIEANQSGKTGNTLACTLTKAQSVFTLTVLRDTIEIAKATFSEAANELYRDENVVVTCLKNGNAFVWTDASSEPAVVNTPAKLTGGTSGDGDVDSATIYTAVLDTLKNMDDTALYEFAVLAAPGLTSAKSSDQFVWQLFAGFTEKDTVTGLSGLIKTVCLVDPLITSEPEDVLTDISFVGDHAQLCVFYPWFKQTNADLGVAIDVPPCFAYLDAFSKNSADGITCRPIAGPDTGAVDVLSISPVIGSNLSATLNDMLVNPIAYHRNFGYYIDGNNVANPSGASRTYKQLSIRQTINALTRDLNNLCYEMSYRLNAHATRNEFQGRVADILSDYKSRGFIFGYKVTIEADPADIADGVITGVVSVFPTPALEVFNIDLRVVNREENL